MYIKWLMTRTYIHVPFSTFFKTLVGIESGKSLKSQGMPAGKMSVF